MTLIDLGGGTPPVSLAEAKAWLRLDGEEEDETLTGLIAAATGVAERETGLALSVRGFRMVIEHRPHAGRVPVPRAPVLALDGLRAYDRAGEESVLDPAAHAWIGPGRDIVLVSDQAFLAGANGVDIAFTAGLAAEAVPADIRRAILIVVADSFEMRSRLGGAAAATTVTDAALTLLARHRRIGL